MTPTVDQAAYRAGRIVWMALLAALAAALLVWLRPQPEAFPPNP